jgi:putative transposase
VVEFNGEPDHVHLLIDYNPKVQISKFVNNLKTVSSRLIRKNSRSNLVLRIQNQFWSGAYFVASCGGVTVEQLKSTSNNSMHLSNRVPVAIPLLPKHRCARLW